MRLWNAKLKIYWGGKEEGSTMKEKRKCVKGTKDQTMKDEAKTP